MSDLEPPRPELPELPIEAWEPTKDTLHLWSQIVGKIKLRTTAPRNHWWHAALYLSSRGITTRRLHTRGVTFELEFDFVDHRLVASTHRGDRDSFPLVDGLSVADFDAHLHALLRQLGVDVAIREEPYGVPMTTPFPDDREHDSYDGEAVHRFWRALDWIDTVFDEFAGWYCGKTSPVHLFWHSFDLAVSRFSGDAVAPPPADRVTREAYSHEVISFGFWAGDRDVREPAFYSYTAPEPAGVRERELAPSQASWRELPTGAVAYLPYAAVRAAPDPRGVLFTFLQSAYEAGAEAAGWPHAGLASSWCPSPVELRQLLERAEPGAVA